METRPKVHPDATPPGESQKFIRNNKYFTISIYALIVILVSAIIFKAVIDLDQTKKGFSRMLGMLSPFIFGALVAYILNPLSEMFSRWLDRLAEKLHREISPAARTALSIFLTYVLVLGFIILTLVFVIPELNANAVDFVNSIPKAYDMLLQQLAKLQERFPNADIQGVTKPLTDAIPELITNLRTWVTNIVPTLYSISMSIANWIINVLITIIVSIYMLYDKKRLMHACWRILYAFVPERAIPQCHEIMAECNRLFSSFIIGKSIDSVIIGVICFVLMTILHLEYAPLISLIVGITNMIPYFGPFIGAITGALILVSIKPLHAFGFLVMILVLQQFDGLILGPKILGSSTGMKPLWIIFAITFGGYIAGVIGMFLGVPLVSFFAYLMNRYLDYRLGKKKIPDSRIVEAEKEAELHKPEPVSLKEALSSPNTRLMRLNKKLLKKS